jgi:hypothetical protein
MEYDALIIGAGPSGSAAATILAEYGHRVLVLEREKFPRYHIGESLIPFTYGPLERLGMIPKMKQSHFVKKVQRHVRVSPTASALAAVLLLQPLRPRNRGADLAGAAVGVRPDDDRSCARKGRRGEGGNDRHLGVAQEDGKVVGVRSCTRQGRHRTEYRARITLDCTRARRPLPQCAMAGACAIPTSTRSRSGRTTKGSKRQEPASTKARPRWRSFRTRAGSGTSRSTTTWSASASSPKASI